MAGSPEEGAVAVEAPINRPPGLGEIFGKAMGSHGNGGGGGDDDEKKWKGALAKLPVSTPRS